MLIGPASAGTDDAARLSAQTAVLYPVMSYSSPESGPDPDAVAGAEAVAAGLGPVTVELPAGAADEQEATLH